MAIKPKGTVKQYIGFQPGLTEFVETKSIEVAAWSPGEPQDEISPTQVHLILDIGDGDTEKIAIVSRFKGPDTLGFLLEELAKYRAEVWPHAEPPNMSPETGEEQ